MKHAPYRPLFFLAAVLALGLYAAAVTIPHVFTAGEPIVAEEVNENFGALASAVQERALPIEVVTTDGYLNLFGDFEIEMELGIDETVETTTRGRWIVRKYFQGQTACEGEYDYRRYFVTIDGEPVRSTAVYQSYENPLFKGVLSGPTDTVIEAGEHVLGVGADCGFTTATSPASTQGVTLASVIVFPE